MTHPSYSNGRPSVAGKPLGHFVPRALLAFLLVYTPWVWAGLRPSFHVVAVVSALILLAWLVFPGRSAATRVCWRDPVFWLGAVLLGYLGMQWANAGRIQYFDVGYQRWTYTAPPWPNWPSSFSRAEAWQMVTWFFPAWVIALAIRSRILIPRELRSLMMWLVSISGLLAVFGLIQFASGTKSIYWVLPMQAQFFASFGYGNHAPPYFVLVGAVAAGLLFREVFDMPAMQMSGTMQRRIRHPGRVAVLGPVLLLCLASAHLGVSRSGVILSGLFFLFFAGYGLVRGWKLLRPAFRINLVAAFLAAGASLYFLVAGLGDQAIRKEFTAKEAPQVLQTVWERVDLELGGRPQFYRAAVQMWQAHPWFGVGGWGYKYRVAEYIPTELWPTLEKRGWANVHFDFLQFLVEFGIVGTGLLLGALGAMAIDLFHPDCRRNSLWVMGLAGLLLVGIFSVIDLPFRCPAVLYAWVAVLAALPQMCADHGSRSVPRGGFLRRSEGKLQAWTECSGPAFPHHERTCR